MSRKQLFALVTVLVTAIAVPAVALFVYPPGSRPNGKSYSVHAADWWKWAATQSVEESAMLDETGENCAVGQARFGLNWYLAGTFGGDPVIRSCDVPFGRTLIFPVINAIAGAFPDDPPEQKTVAFQRSVIAGTRERATNLEVEIDGKPIHNIDRFYEESVPFSFRLPEDNLFGAPAGTLVSPAVDNGFYLAVAPLGLGEHTVHIHGELDDVVVDVTYNLRVKLFVRF
jgi:hypothetical protein